MRTPRPRPTRLGAAMAGLLLASGSLMHAAPALGQVSAAAAATATAAVRQEARLALVIGNGAYRDAPLANPANDARAMAEALRAAGFTVALHIDIDHRGMRNALREFGDRLRGGGVGVFYFAGHGMQVKGRNFLIPVGAEIEREDELAYAAIDAQSVLDKMETAGNGTNLMILDACRNNPFSRSFRSATQGLAQMDAPVGTLVAFATAPGSVASDGAASNGLYTSHLLQAIRQPGLKVEDVFKQVRAAVRRESQGKQVPWESTSLEGDFFFHRPPAPVDPAVALDDSFWATVRDSRDAAELRAYLRRFPQGRHAAEARSLLVALAPPPAPAPTPAPTPAPAPAPAPVPTSNLAAALPAPPKPAPALPATTSAVAAPTVPPAMPALAPALALAPTPAPPAPAPAPAPVTASAAATADADAERRTQAWLAELVRQGEAEKAARTKPGTRTPAGFTVGDRYQFQVVDKYRGEVVRNLGFRVARIEPDGGFLGVSTLTSANPRFDPLGRLVSWTNAQGEARRVAPHNGRWWENMQVGEQRDFEYTEHWPDRSNRVKLRSRVTGFEGVRVPAGEFLALRVEHRGTVSAIGRPGYGSISVTVWYVPELRLPVAVETETTWDGRPGTREREELISHALVDPPA